MPAGAGWLVCGGPGLQKHMCDVHRGRASCPTVENKSTDCFSCRILESFGEGSPSEAQTLLPFLPVQVHEIRIAGRA